MRKAASHSTIAALAGLLLSTGSARAADLGGNCCADLEERVAELEATTVRKGNRRVSLTVSGQVNRSLLYWNDGFQHDVYSVDNAIANSRFRFTGSAKLSSEYSAGFYMEFDLSLGARSHQVSQIDDDGFNGTGGILGGAPFGDGIGAAGDSVLGFNQAYWYVESKTYGRLSVGRLTTSTAGIGIIDLSNTGVVANSQPYLWGGGMIMRNGLSAFATTATANTLVWGQLCGGPGIGGGGPYGVDCGLHALTRRDGVSYTSPTWSGFTFSGTFGEDDFYDTAVRYAGEWFGFRVAAGLGYRWFADREADLPFPDTAPFIDKRADTERREWLSSISVMHIATGLFASGAWVQYQYDGTTPNELYGFGFFGERNRPDTNLWWADIGIQKNWTGLGATTFYAELGKVFDGITGLTSLRSTTGACSTTTATAAGTSGLCAIGGAGIVTSSDMTWTGGGAVQTIDAAAMDLYLGFRIYWADADFSDLPTVAARQIDGGLESIWYVQAGARIQF